MSVYELSKHLVTTHITGVARQPCSNDQRFQFWGDHEYKGSVDWNNLPKIEVPVKVSVPFYDHKECYYENDGTGSFGELNCYHPKYIVAMPGGQEFTANLETGTSTCGTMMTSRPIHARMIP